MSETTPTTAAARRPAVFGLRALSRVERREFAVFAVGTLAAWAHTADEIRIGELIAVPFGLANAALFATWPRLRPGWRAVTAIAFGLFWALAVIPYHLVPLLEGVVTGQNVSGLLRIIGGAAMVSVGIAILLRRGHRRGAPPGL